MRRVTLRSLWAHKRRLLSTVLAVVLGVSFMAGTFVLSTTLDQSFGDLFEQVVSDVDGVVQGEVLFTDLLNGDQRANLPEALIDEVRDVPGVSEAEGRVSTEGSLSFNRILGPDGEPLGGGQSTTILESWIVSEDLSPYEITDGRAPEADDEMVLNVAALEDDDVSVGDRVEVVTQSEKRSYTVVGAFSFGAAKSVGGAITAGFTLPEAQRIAGLEDEVEAVWAKATGNVSEEELVERLGAVLGPQQEAVTGTQAAAQLSKEGQTNLGFLEIALAVFGGIALLVGIFVISNTFSILVAQRTKELALLRALGASRGQVLGSVLLEASVVGVVASALGVLGGFGLAKGVTAGLAASGAQLPSARLVVEPDSIALALFIGVAITLIASLFPAVRATRVPPLAALRDIAIDRSNLSKGRLLAGTVGLLVGGYLLSGAWRSDGDTKALPTVAIGAVLVIVGFLVVGPVFAGRTVRLLGLPLPRFTGVTGRLATENAARSPKRTSATASAVVIGVALVVFITVFAASATKSVTSEVSRGFKADLVVTSKQEGLNIAPGIPSGVADLVEEVPGIDVVSPLGFGSIGVQYPDGGTASHILNAIKPESIAQVFSPRMLVGDVQDLTDEGVLLNEGIVEDHDLQIGDPIILLGGGGKTARLELQGVSDDRNLLGLVSVTRDRFAALNDQTIDVQVAATVDAGEDIDEVIERVEGELEGYPGVQVLDKDGFIGNLIDQITQYITLIQGLLVLSIITALVGVANTLSLSITERTRELGLLRAIGMDRSGVRSTVRWEAFLISLLGGVVGVSLGMLLSIAVVKAMQGFGLAVFAFPTIGLVVILAATSALGTLASVRPARRAAGLSILDAIATD